MSALRMRGVRKRYRKTIALDGLDLDVPRGSIFGLIGPNGAGKTTAFSIAAGAIRPDEGEIDVLGGGRFDPSRHAGRLSLLPQDCELSPHSNAEQLLGFYGRLQGMSARESAADALRVLELVRLRDRARSRIRELSHGMKRRLAVAQALLGKPELVLLDEPTGGLDPHLVVETREMLRGLRGQCTLVVSSHILSDLEAICDHVAFVEAGRCVRSGTIDAVMRRSGLIRVRVGNPPPLEAIEVAIAPSTATIDGSEIVVSIDGEDVAAANARILRALLDHGVEVLEVKLGESLESAYLASRKA